MQPPEEVAHPNRERLTTADRRILVLVAAVVAFSAFFVARNYRAAFPTASLQLKYSRNQITQKALDYVRSRGWSVDGYQNFTLFDTDDDARLFLEREAGLGEANRLMESEVAVWNWRARWFRPPNKEEFLVFLSPDGRLTGFEHVIEENAPGGRLAPEEAQRRAQTFLESQTPKAHRLIEARREQRPNRDDHTFTWEQDGFGVKGSTYRRQVTVRGDEIAAYAEFLHVPEQWTRDFSTLRSKNELYSQIAQAFFLMLIGAAVVLVLHSGARWRALALIAAAIGLAMMLAQWNNLPFVLDAMPTSADRTTATVIALLEGVGAGVGVLLYVLLAAGAGEMVYRRMHPRRLTLASALSWRGVRTREFFRASVAGYGFAALHLIFLIAFYLIGQRFGVWSPQDIEYSNLLSTRFPWLYPLSISLMAAFSEEFWFRLFAQPLVERITRSAWLSVLIPAFVWGFLHANYPQQPGYIRGIEVGLIGVGAGWLMRRFGILSTLIWHYTIDAGLIGSMLMTSESLYFRLSGLVVTGAVLLPLAVSLVSYRRNGGFLASPELLNRAQPDAKRARLRTERALGPPVAPVWPRKPLWIAAAVLAVGGALAPSARYADWVRVAQDRNEAVQAAPAPPGKWRTVADFVGSVDQPALEYLRRNVGAAEADRLLRDFTLHGAWRVRHFRELDKEEWRHFVNESGRPIRTDHVLDEKAPGANLDESSARKIAEAFVSAERGLPLDKLTLSDSSATRRERRTDHFFTWDDTRFQVGEAKARVSLVVQGDEVSSFRRFIKLPEEWVRAYSKPRLTAFLVPAIGGGLALLALGLFLRRIAHQHLHWVLYLKIAGAAGLVLVLAEFNAWPSFFVNYDTSHPISDHVSGGVLGSLTRVLMSVFVVLLACAVTHVFLAARQGERRLRGCDPLVALAIAVCTWGFLKAGAWVESLLPGDRHSLALAPTPDVAAWLPGASVIAGALFAATAGMAIAGAAVLAVLTGYGSRGRAIYAVIIALAVALSRGSSPALFAYWAIWTLLALVLVSLVVRTCGEALLSAWLAVFAMQSLSGVRALMVQPAPSLKMQAAVAAAGSALIAFVWWWRFRERRDAQPLPQPLAPEGSSSSGTMS